MRVFHVIRLLPWHVQHVPLSVAIISIVFKVCSNVNLYDHIDACVSRELSA